MQRFCCNVPTFLSFDPSVNGSCEGEYMHASLVEFYWEGKMKGLGGKPVPVPLYPPHIHMN
jgi:hypothetical protein